VDEWLDREKPAHTGSDSHANLVAVYTTHAAEGIRSPPYFLEIAFSYNCAMHSRPAATKDSSDDFTLLRGGGLTPRQCEVLTWVAHGKRDADIARILGIAPKTVGKHIEHLLAKLHAENRTGAVSLARERLRQLRAARG